ncbi:MAG: hypothetical protein AAB870_01280, partial [Patescibacteria group bacterium]
MKKLASHNRTVIVGIAFVAVFLLVIGLGYTPQQKHAPSAGAAVEDFYIINGWAWNQKVGWIKQRGLVGDTASKIGNYG